MGIINHKTLIHNRRPLMVFVATLSLCLVLTAGSVASKRDAKMTHDAINQRVQQLTDELHHRHANQLGQAEHMEEFRKLQSIGVVGKENRLAWTEAIKSVSQGLNIKELEYTILRQQPVDIKPRSSHRIFSSTMRISTRLPHAVTMLRFFELLRAAEVGTFNVRQCEMQRLPTEYRELYAHTANIQTECEVDWLTLAPRVS